MANPAVASQFATAFGRLSAHSEDYVPEIVRLILSQARLARASDVHLVPGETSMIMHWRIDGVLHAVAGFDREISVRVIARLKVISGLLTYRTDIPQEGRVAREHSSTEVRVTTFPTLHGEKAAIRLFAESDQLQRLSQLGLPEDLLHVLRRDLEATAGVILLTGPSGSGKTTTAYACLRDIIEQTEGARCIMSLEDPIEVAIEGATQSQVRPSAGFDLATGLRSLMRQDPDVILVGEIRDPATAEAAFQAALTGHLVITTFHAGSSAEAIARLLDMQIEPYLIRSSLRSVICQRLLRRRCPECSGALERTKTAERTGAPQHKERRAAVDPVSQDVKEFLTQTDKSKELCAPAAGCVHCGFTGYRGRLVLAELLDPDQPETAKAILNRIDSRQLAAIAQSSGMQMLRENAEKAVTDGLTTRAEVLRVLGSHCRNEG